MIPFAVVGSDHEYQVNGKRILGRKTKWGTIEGTGQAAAWGLRANQKTKAAPAGLKLAHRGPSSVLWGPHLLLCPTQPQGKWGAASGWSRAPGHSLMEPRLHPDCPQGRGMPRDEGSYGPTEFWVLGLLIQRCAVCPWTNCCTSLAWHLSGLLAPSSAKDQAAPPLLKSPGPPHLGVLRQL